MNDLVLFIKGAYFLLKVVEITTLQLNPFQSFRLLYFGFNTNNPSLSTLNYPLSSFNIMSSQTTAQYFPKIYSLTSVDHARSVYDEWAKTYNEEITGKGQDYVGPAIAAAYVPQALGTPTINPDVEILDAGCGTGLVGVFLARLGSKKLDGVDLSPGMLDEARTTGAYRNLDVCDLSRPLPAKNDSYDVVTCVGTLTQSHVGPEAISEFVRVVKPGGYIVATVIREIWQTGGYESHVKSLAEQNKVKVLSAEVQDYRRGAGAQAYYLVLQVSA